MNGEQYGVKVDGQIMKLTTTIQTAYDEAMVAVKEVKGNGGKLERLGTRGVGRFWQGHTVQGNAKLIEVVKVG